VRRGLNADEHVPSCVIFTRSSGRGNKTTNSTIQALFEVFR
jgi:hypothetical protein